MLNEMSRKYSINFVELKKSIIFAPENILKSVCYGVLSQND